MGRRKRIEFFFILYLLAIVVFAVLSRERDKVDLQLRDKTREMVRSLLTYAPIGFESDTIFVYVDVPDGSTEIDASPYNFTTIITISDVGSEDDVRVILSSILRDNVLVSPQIVRILDRQAVGSLADRTVRFPVHCSFTRTGVYSLRFIVESNRIEQSGKGWFRYRGTVVHDTLIPPDILRGASTVTRTLTMVVEDTSVSTTLPVEPIELSFSRGVIRTAIGYEEENPLTVSQAFLDPSLRLVKGIGSIERQAREASTPLFVWRGVATKNFDSIVVESRVKRDAGGKDITRASFLLRAVPPFQRQSIPAVAYAGEDLGVSVAVDGLDTDALYSWDLYEVVRSGEVAKKDSGSGPVVRYHIPNNFTGKTLRLTGQYKGKPYRCISQVSHIASAASFDVPVVEPPMRIAMTLPATVRATHRFEFRAMRYSDERYANDRPIGSLRDIEISMTKENGTNIRLIPEAIAAGRFAFSIANTALISTTGDRVVLTIRAKGETFTRRFTVFREGR